MKTQTLLRLALVLLVAGVYSSSLGYPAAAHGKGWRCRESCLQLHALNTWGWARGKANVSFAPEFGKTENGYAFFIIMLSF